MRTPLLHFVRFLAVVTLMSAPTSTFAAPLALAAAKPPFAAKKPKDVSLHGDTRIDDYFWLRDKTDAAVLAHLRAENAYTEAATAPLQPLREALYREMVGRIKESDSNPPAKKGEWWYYSRTEQGKQYPIYCRKHRSTDAAEQVILDVNALAKEKSSCPSAVRSSATMAISSPTPSITPATANISSA